jgi:DNA segregation ATPase FtsK/SpoIIIE-like protein
VGYIVAYETLAIVVPPVLYVLAGVAILALLIGGVGGVLGLSTIGFEMVRTRLAQLRGQQVEFAASAQMAITEQELMRVTIKQIERGIIHAGKLATGTTFSSFPAQIINQIEARSEDAPPPPLPERVDLSQLLREQPTLDRLVLGVTENNQIVTESLRNLTHVAIAGVTRFGKSIFVQQLLYQIATAQEKTDLYLADLGGTTFIDFGLPYASTLRGNDQSSYG